MLTYSQFDPTGGGVTELTSDNVIFTPRIKTGKKSSVVVDHFPSYEFDEELGEEELMEGSKFPQKNDSKNKPRRRRSLGAFSGFTKKNRRGSSSHSSVKTEEPPPPPRSDSIQDSNYADAMRREIGMLRAQLKEKEENEQRMKTEIAMLYQRMDTINQRSPSGGLSPSISLRNKMKVPSQTMSLKNSIKGFLLVGGKNKSTENKSQKSSDDNLSPLLLDESGSLDSTTMDNGEEHPLSPSSTRPIRHPPLSPSVCSRRKVPPLLPSFRSRRILPDEVFVTSPKSNSLSTSLDHQSIKRLEKVAQQRRHSGDALRTAGASVSMVGEVTTLARPNRRASIC